jgi:hypothetical protein
MLPPMVGAPVSDRLFRRRRTGQITDGLWFGGAIPSNGAESRTPSPKNERDSGPTVFTPSLENRALLRGTAGLKEYIRHSRLWRFRR